MFVESVLPYLLLFANVSDAIPVCLAFALLVTCVVFPQCNETKLRAVAQRGPGGKVRRAPRDLVGFGRRAGLPTGEAREGRSDVCVRVHARMCTCMILLLLLNDQDVWCRPEFVQPRKLEVQRG